MSKMHILNVEVKDCRFSEETGRHKATLLVDCHESRVCLQAATHLARAAGQRDVIHGLMADALRQMKRLPEYRNTTEEITVAPSALPI
ncbi:hypothetical protein [Roseovarius sp. 2305UL8-3]|uniref:hypothetical protein n=1 Tax=Roseovarius conchicola TaxID=3121636 RepID=UPI0035288390